MIDAYLEKQLPNDAKVLFNFSEDAGTTVYVQETTRYRIKVNSDSDNVSVFLGHLQLQGYEYGEFIYFSLEFENNDLAKDSGFFDCIFINLIGNSDLVFETDEGEFTFGVEIESAKTNADEVQAWMNSISQTFPLYHSPKILSPISYLPARNERQTNFFSIYTLLAETNHMIGNLTKKVKAGGYLKRKFIRYNINGGGNEIFDYEKPQNWFSEDRRWNISSSTNKGQVKINNVYFEPYNLPKNTGRHIYNTDLNRLLVTSLHSLRASLGKYQKSIPEIMGEFGELRTQFRKNHSKYQVGSRLQQSIKSTVGKIEYLLRIFLKLKILPVNQAGPPTADRRYIGLISDIWILNRLDKTYRVYAEKGKGKLGLLGVDQIFEMFCHAEIVNVLLNIGFEIIDMDEDKIYNQYLSLWNDDKKIGLRIFYDVSVPKISEQNSGHPLIDYFQLGSPKRPDFLLHFYNDKHEKVAILDAKYKTLETCKNDFKKFNAENLLVKYGTKFFSKTEPYLPPFFIGAICLNNSREKQCETVPLVSKNKGSLTSEPFQEAAIVELHSLDRSSLEGILRHLIRKFEIYPSRLDQKSSIDVSRPTSRRVKESAKMGKKADSRKTNVRKITGAIRDMSTQAPTLSVDDAAQIKGMLARGDKPQDIAFWFGVNNGRISEIKNSRTFIDVKPATPECLPRKGPYPSLRELHEGISKGDR